MQNGCTGCGQTRLRLHSYPTGFFEQVACYTPAADIALWFPLSAFVNETKSTFDGLSAEQTKTALLAAAEKAEAHYLEQAKTSRRSLC